MPPTKRKKTSIKCACGAVFATAGSYGNHAPRCLTFLQQSSSRQLHHAANNIHPDELQQDESHRTIRQQRNNINSHKPAMEEILMQQRQEQHAVRYASHISRMKEPNSTGLTTGTCQQDNATDSPSKATDSKWGNDEFNPSLFDSTDHLETDALADENQENEKMLGSETDNIHINPTSEPIFPIHGDDDPMRHIKFDGNVSPSTSAGIQLMQVLGKHTTDLSLYDDLVRFIGDLADQGYDFKQRIPNRRTLHNTCEKTFNYTQLQPKLVPVPVATMSIPTVQVPVFDIQAVLRKMLCNPRLMQQANFAADYDIFTGTGTRIMEESKGSVESTSYYDEIHTGQRWQPAVDHYCAGDDNLFPCGLVVFYDKSHADRHGSLSVAPFIFTLTLFNKTARSKSEFWDVLAYIPNLDYATTKSSDSSIKQATSPALKCQDEHNCLYAACRQLKDVNDNGGIRVCILGKIVYVKVWIHIVVGDIAGNNSLLGSYNNANVNCPYRDCGCSKEDFVNPHSTCTMIQKSDIDRMKEDNNIDALKAASKHNIVNAFDTIPTGDPINTIYRSTPPETMHAICSGVAPRMLTSIGDGFKKKQTASVLHNLHLLLAKRHAWQSERDFPRPSQRNYVLETSKTQATEIMGNLFLLLCALHTTMGESICESAGVSRNERKGKIITLKMILALEKWFNRRNVQSDIDDSSRIDSFVRETLIPNLQRFFPRDEGMQWMFPKVHSLTKFSTFIQAFGSGINFYGGFGESHLKVFMKQYAHYTQRRPGKFAEQLATNHYRHSLFEHSLNCIREQTKMNYDLVPTQGGDKKFTGEHEIKFTRQHTNSSSIANVQFSTNVIWKKTSSSKTIDPTLQYAISQYMAAHVNCSTFRVTGYTSAKLSNSKETLENYDAAPSHSIYRTDTQTDRNDWCMIFTHALGSDVEDERLDVWEYVCPARIHGFVRFETPGLPTPSLLQKHGADMISSLQLMDETMYVIVRTPQDFIHWNELEKEFIVPIQLGDLDSCTFILPVSRIVNPLYVFEDHGQSPKDGVSFFASIPARYWAFYLDYKLNTDSSPGPCGYSQNNIM